MWDWIQIAGWIEFIVIALTAAAVVVAGLLAQQIYQPNSRVIKLLAGLVLMGVAIRTRPFYALCFIALFFLFPFSIFVMRSVGKGRNMVRFRTPTFNPLSRRR